MGVSTTTAARIFDGQNKGHSGEENVLSWEEFPYTALSKVYNVDVRTPDSAGTATAFATGVKTRKGRSELYDQELICFILFLPFITLALFQF